MRNRTTRRDSGLVLEQTDRRTIDWAYDSKILGRVRGELEYSDQFDGGWSITGLPAKTPGSVDFWLIPLPLMEAVAMIEGRLHEAERDATKPDPKEERMNAELNELFGV